MTEDPREAAARYRLHREDPDAAAQAAAEAEASAARFRSEADRAAIVETAIQQAIRRGDFDDLPGAGKPIPGLGSTTDPDWWIRRKIERERLTGLGPPALTLRTEYAGLMERVDGMSSATDVREHLEDFNRRVIDARRQLLGGPPVVTPTVDIEEWVAAWHVRRIEETARRSVPAEPRPRRRRFGWLRR